MDNAEVKKLANELANLYLRSYEEYKPLVEDACSRMISEKNLEWLLEHILDFCAYDKMYDLFSELCDTYLGIYPECVKDYKAIYKDLFEETAL